MKDNYSKLIMLGARWYDSEIGRFVSADSIVPRPGNPQNLNRFSYAINNPIRYSDPTGHDYLCGVDCDEGNWSPTLGVFGIVLEGDWDPAFVPDIFDAAMAVGAKLGETLGELAWVAFRQVYGLTSQQPMVLRWGNCPDCDGGGAFTYSPRLIAFESMSTGRTDSSLRRRNHVTHELGHALDQKLSKSPRKVLEDTQASVAGFPDRLAPPDGRTVGPNFGFASGQNVFTWQQNPSASAAEEFADSFLGWTYDTWETRGDALTVDGQARRDFMNSHMPGWINQLVPPR